MNTKIIVPTVIVLSVIFLIGKTAYDHHRQYHGICLEEGRVLTDEELIRSTIAFLNTSPRRAVPVRMPGNEETNYKPYTNYISYERVRYESVDAFLEENPDCCSVELKLPSWWLSRANGSYVGDVTVNYTLRYLDENGVEQQTQDRLDFMVQNCGTVN